MRFAIAAVCCFSIVFGMATSEAATKLSLDGLLARARASSGSPYRYHVVSRSREAIEGRTYEVTTETEGLKYRVERCYKTICSGFYFDGDRSYDSNFNDTALPLAAEIDGLQLTLRAIASYAFAAPDFRAKGGQLVERESVLRAGKTYRQIAVAQRFGALLDAVIDPETGIVGGVVSDERRLAFEFRDERKVGDKLLLAYTIALNGNVIERFDDRRIVPEPLAAPAGIVPKFSGPATIAMRRPERTTDQPIVPCTIGGQSVACLLDTGNSAMAMSLELSENLGLEPQTGAFGISGVGQYVTGVVKGTPLTVGPATYPSAQYVVLHDLHQYGYDIVLGTDAFAHARVTIDYAGHAVSFAPVQSGGSTGDLSFENFIPVAPIKLGDLGLRLALDTGDESAINLSYDLYQAHPMLFKAHATVPVAGIGGSADQVTGNLPVARFGDFELHDVPIGATKKLAATSMGHIGSGLLSNFTVTFDYAHARIELVPRPGDAKVTAISPASR